MKRFASLGNALICIGVILFLVAWNRGIALLYGMFALILATLILAWVVPRWMLSGVSALRHHPASAVEGDLVRVDLEIHNRSRLGRYMLEVWDHLPFAPKDFRQSMGFIPQIRRQTRVVLDVPCELRGEYLLGDLTLKTGFPFGVYSASRQIPTKQSSLLVYPALIEVGRFDYLGNDSLPAQGNHAIIRSGGSGDTLGVREYRRGDSPRYIHWPSSAHHGQIMVRELEWVSTTQVTLLLDLNRASVFGEGKESTLEYAVRIAASLARHALDEGHKVALLGYAMQRLEIPFGRGEQHFETIMQALARVKADGSLSYSESLRLATEQSGGQGVLVLFENPSPHGTYNEPVDLQHPARVSIRFDTGSFLYPARRPSMSGRQLEQGRPVYSISRGADLPRVFAE